MAHDFENVPARRSSLSEFDPFRDLLRPSRVSRLLNDSWFESKALEHWAPPMDVVESKDAYTITLEVPGAKKEDVTVECHDGVGPWCCKRATCGSNRNAATGRHAHLGEKRLKTGALEIGGSRLDRREVHVVAEIDPFDLDLF